MTEKSYTISMMFRDKTHWNVYSRQQGLRLIEYAMKLGASGEAHYESLATALLCQHQFLEPGDVAFPLRVVARFDAYRKKLKKEGQKPEGEYAEVLELALKGHLRATNGLEIKEARLKSLGIG